MPLSHAPIYGPENPLPRDYRDVYRKLLSKEFSDYKYDLLKGLHFVDSQDELVEALANYCTLNDKVRLEARQNLSGQPQMIWKKNGYKVFLDQGGNVCVQRLAKLDSQADWTWVDDELLLTLDEDPELLSLGDDFAPKKFSDAVEEGVKLNRSTKNPEDLYH